MICVVGGSGFVGTRLCARLRAQEIEFTIVDKVASSAFPERSIVADVRNVNQLMASVPSCNALINLAAEHRDDVRPVSLYDEVNVQGALNIVAVAELKSIQKIIFTSSVACYGFATPGTGEDGQLRPFNDYGRTKMEAEAVFREWQFRDNLNRALVIVRPAVIFGERNRGNVYNLLRQIASGKFVMVGSGESVKSMAYVENVAAFLQHCFGFAGGVHLFNYVDGPDLDMNTLVSAVRRKLGKSDTVFIRVPYAIGYAAGKAADCVSWLTGRLFPISAIRVKKFCTTTQFSSAATKTGFQAPYTLMAGLERTVGFEFLEDHRGEPVFFSE